MEERLEKMQELAGETFDSISEAIDEVEDDAWKLSIGDEALGGRAVHRLACGA